MIFSPDKTESYSRLKAALRNLSEEQRPELYLPQDTDFPLLILETSGDSVGFAIVNGKPQPAYASAYDSFKRLYRQNHTDWKGRNLSFVVCRSEHDPTHDAYFSSIETDVYFCRKYVVSLRRNPDELVQELLRLPFLPFPEGGKRGILRPPSAQTLLQSQNVSAQLARQIVVPQQYSANRIVDQLLAENEPLSTIGKKSTALDIKHEVQPTEHTRIKKVVIEAFRAYKKKQEFNVDADVIVLFGPNGLGKTSFFDAIDYACTGRIGRLCRTRISQDDFTSLARHLGTSGNKGCVSIQVGNGNKNCEVTRRITDWSVASIGDKEHERASVLQFLTSAQWEKKKPRIENLERLFRATHLFGQSDRELLVDFEQESTLSHDIVQRMLALDDYASGVTKATAVLRELEKRLAAHKMKESDLSSKAYDVQSQIKSMSKPQDVKEAGKQARDMATNLAKDIHTYVGVKIEDIEPSQSSTLEWRAMAESTLQDSQDRLRKLQNLESGFAQFAEKRSALKQIKGEITKIEQELKAKTEVHKDQQTAIKKLSDGLKHERVCVTESSSRLNVLTELGDLLEIYQGNKKSLHQWRVELKRIAGEEATTTAELQPLLKVAEGLRNKTDELREVVLEKLPKIKVLVFIQNNIPSWERDCAIIIDLKQNIVDARSSLQTSNATIDKLKTEIATKEKRLVIHEKEYKDHEANKFELTKLLDEIETHVENSICPTCGIDHKSKADLLERINAQKKTRPAHVEELARCCADLCQTLQQDRAALKIQVDAHSAQNSALEELTKKLAEVDDLVKVFERTVVGAELSMNKQLSATVARLLIELKTANSSLQETLSIQETELLRTNKRVAELEQKQTQQAEAQKRANTATLPLEQQIALSRSKAEDSGSSMEMSQDELKTEIEMVASRKTSAEERKGEIIPQIEQLSPTLNEMAQEIGAITDKRKALYQDKIRLKEEVLRYEESCVEVIGRKRNVTELDVISEQGGLAMARVDHLDSLRKRCLTLERLVDATQRSAMLSDLETQSQNLQKEKESLTEKIEGLLSVKKWISSVKSILDRQSSSAVAKHVDAFGPLTSLIQKRLRAVYGFGDVSLLAKGNEINVEVSWGNEHVKPADYFSDSQKQILMLSLFLSGRLTQSWSSFSPILMDDPVTHFDDLNAFGFVELIRGLVSTSPGKKQFFISTCEDRLYELMLRKFKGVAGGAKFFKFEGIGHDGPIVIENKSSG